MLRLEIKHLRLVSTIAEVGNLTRAAHMLCLSQPAMSKQLAELEERLGFALFHRTRKAMCLTEPGVDFHARARKILGDMDALETELKRYGKGTTGKLRISIDSVHHAGWLPSVMKKFRTRHPGIELEVRHVPELLTSLRQREIDVAVIGEAIETPGVDYIPLNEDEMVAVLPPAHPLLRKECISVHDLAGADMLYYFELEQSYLYRRYLYPNRVSLGSFHHIQSIDAIIKLVQAGEGMSILPKRMVQEALGKGEIEVRPIGQEGFVFTWYAALFPESEKPYLSDFIGLLKSTVANIPERPESMTAAARKK
ncbi:MAG TPA: LysR family transcriptional regulator [Noviherbaspirillum sp.]|nr:LysR family transcriptional regulator [Noviherbaspirillum sp.]